MVSIHQTGEAAAVELRLVKEKMAYSVIETSNSDGGYCPNPAELARQVSVTTKSSPIALDLAVALSGFWQTTLRNLGKPAQVWVSDGTFYYASTWSKDHGLLCGESWSPDTGRSLAMVKISEGLRSLAEEGGDQASRERELWNLISFEGSSRNETPTANDVPPL